MAPSTSIPNRPQSSRILSPCIWLLLWLALNSPLSMADKTAADYFVRSLPGQPEGPLLKMHAGHVEVSHEHNGNLFFWHFQNRHAANRQRTVIWLNGGPGCSSEDGALMEIGPYRVTSTGNLTYNEGSWDEFANLLFVDNPVGTGFSYVNGDSYLHELNEMADQFMVFLEKWFEIFPDYEDDDLYLAGESYAGQHLPYIARAILDRNADSKTKSDKKWNLKGMLIGNGWIAPVEQYMSYADFAYAEGLIQGGTDAAAKLDKVTSDCYAELNKPGAEDRININRCESVLTTILSLTSDNNDCINMYDIRLKDTWPSCGMNWPPDLTQITPYLRRGDVTRALNVNSDKRTGWTECAGGVSQSFRALNSKSSRSLLPDLLKEIPVLLFSGAKDMICNHLGTEDFISKMQWNGGTGFEISPGTWAPKRHWIFEGESAGIYQEARNLTYVLFYNSSHMVPFDYPRRSRDMLDRFMGVDIASIGGKPVDSQIDGAKSGPETSVGGHPNSTAAQENTKEKLHAAELKAYYRSGEVAFVVVVIAAALFGWWVWTRRRKAQDDSGGEYAPVSSGLISGHPKGKPGDLEAQAFDEAELDDLSSGSGSKKERRSLDADPYDLGSDSEEEYHDDVGARDEGGDKNEKK